MTTHVWNGTSPHTRKLEDGRTETIAPGAEFEPTEAELRAFGDLILSVGESGSGESENGEPVSELEEAYGARVAGVLTDNGIASTAEVDGMSDEELLDLKGFGRSSLKVVRGED